MDRALSLPRVPGVSRSLVVVTDGYVEAEARAFELVHEGLGDANVFAFGIGTSVNRYLVEGLARAGQGEATIVTDDVDAAEALRRFRGYVSSPLLSGVSVEARGLELLDQQPAQLADLFAARPLVVTGRWRGQPTGTITVSGTSAAGWFTSTVDVAAADSTAGGLLPRLWARQRVAELSDWNFGHPTGDQEDEILALGLQHELLTTRTSFVAVTEEIRTDGSRVETVVQPLPLPRDVEDSAVGYGQGGYGTGSGDEPGLVVLAVLAALVVLFGARRGRRAPAEPAGA